MTSQVIGIERHHLFDIISVETLGFCNRTCWFCKFGQEREDKPPVRMRWETIERIVLNLEDLQYRGRVSWFCINEPLLDKRMTEILRFSRSRLPYAVLTLNTNGDLLTEDKYFELRAAGLDGLTISIYDDEASRRVTRMKLDDRCVLHDMREGSASQDKLFNRGGSIKTSDGRFDGDAYRYLDASCKRPFHMFTVNARSEAVLCCQDMYADVEMGNVDEERLEDIWSNEKFTHYRTTLKEKGRRGLELCEGCSDPGTSSIPYPPAWARRLPTVEVIRTAVGGLVGGFSRLAMRRSSK